MPYDKTHRYVLHVTFASFYPVSVKCKERSWRIRLLSEHDRLGRLELARRVPCKMFCMITEVKYIVFL